MTSASSSGKLVVAIFGFLSDEVVSSPSKIDIKIIKTFAIYFLTSTKIVGKKD